MTGLLVASPTYAQTIEGRATGLTGSFFTIDFNTLGLSTGQLVTNQYAVPYGVTFSGGVFYGVDAEGIQVFPTPALATFDPYEGVFTFSSLTILFSAPVSGAAFNLATVGLTEGTLLKAFLGANEVDDFTAFSGDSPEQLSLFWGFENSWFDKIVISNIESASDPNLVIDNLQVAVNTVVPEPSTVALTITGLIVLAGIHQRRRRKQ